VKRGIYNILALGGAMVTSFLQTLVGLSEEAAIWGLTILVSKKEEEDSSLQAYSQVGLMAC